MQETNLKMSHRSVTDTGTEEKKNHTMKISLFTQTLTKPKYVTTVAHR